MITLKTVEERARRDARQRGIFLTNDLNNLKVLLEGLRDNEEKYGYPSCPCRLATGIFDLDRDIICPCDYRDPDVVDFGSCFCNLYIDQEVSEGKKNLVSVPERRPSNKQYTILGKGEKGDKRELESSSETRKIHYCKQCGYMVFREEPPYRCPICQAKREMFDTVKVKIMS